MSKIVRAVFKQIGKETDLGHFGYKSAKIAKMRFFSKNRALLHFSPYSALTSCAKAKKSLEPFLRKTIITNY